MTVAPIPADRRRYPPDCPDPDWCRGNRSCYWRCNADDGDVLLTWADVAAANREDAEPPAQGKLPL